MGITGYGGTLGGSVTGTLSNIRSITWTGVDGEVIVLKTLADVNRFASKIAGSNDAGELSVECEYDKTQFSTLISRQGQSVETWTSTLPDGTTIVCSGFIRNVSDLSETTADAMTYTSAIPLSGEPTVTPAP